MSGLTIPMEAADLITVTCLKEQREYLKKELRDHKKKGTYLHVDDKLHNKHIVKCLDEIIRYYGG